MILWKRKLALSWMWRLCFRKFVIYTYVYRMFNRYQTKTFRHLNINYQCREQATRSGKATTEKRASHSTTMNEWMPLIIYYHWHCDSTKPLYSSQFFFALLSLSLSFTFSLSVSWNCLCIVYISIYIVYMLLYMYIYVTRIYLYLYLYLSSVVFIRIGAVVPLAKHRFHVQLIFA